MKMRSTLSFGLIVGIVFAVAGGAGNPAIHAAEVAAPAPAPVPVPASLRDVTPVTRLICGGGATASYDARIRAVRTLGRSIPANDFFALQDFLEKKPDADVVTADQLNAIKNDVAGRLLSCEHLPDGFSQRFLAMVRNPAVGLVWQNYTIQFLDALWQRDADPVVRKEIFGALVVCARDPRVTISGTALLTLSRLPETAWQEGAAVPVARRTGLANLAMGIVLDEKLPWQDKITAVHIAADLGDVRALVRARVWVSDAAVPVMLKMASLSVIGKLGDSADVPLVERFSKSGDFRLRSAAKAALKKIK